MGFFHMASVNLILSVNYEMNILLDKYFKTVFWVDKWQFASVNSWALRFFDHSQGRPSVATYLRYGGIFKYMLVADLPLSLSVKELWKSVNI